MHHPRLLGVAGSLRAGSYNTAILNTLKDAIAPKATLTVFPLNDVPLYDEDLDTDTPPEAVAALRRAIGEADGLVIAAPEYNYGISGVLKNALDWASRPYGRATITGKPVLTLSSSPAFTGGVRAQAQLTGTLVAIGARPVGGPQIVIGQVHEKVVDGRLVDAPTLAFLRTATDGLLREAGLPAAEAA